MSGPYQPGDTGSNAHPERTKDDDELTFGALEQILDQTLKAAANRPDSAADALSDFAEVARTHRGKAFKVDPVVVELVRAVLESQVGSRLTPAMLDNLSQCIAVTLCDDPNSRERLERLWARLSGQRP
ncbi:MAG TPA: hypothetical protein VHZ24_02325 [Pirellulales bacterium]|jgi:hypothetical protein|nr:hypothetical protein [Pirellulales bacterium]